MVRRLGNVFDLPVLSLDEERAAETERNQDLLPTSTEVLPNSSCTHTLCPAPTFRVES